MRHVRDAQGVRHGPDVLVILMHDARLLDMLEFFPKADLAGWEMNPSRKDIGRWRFLSDFRKVSWMNRILMNCKGMMLATDSV